MYLSASQQRLLQVLLPLRIRAREQRKAQRWGDGISLFRWSTKIYFPQSAFDELVLSTLKLWNKQEQFIHSTLNFHQSATATSRRRWLRLRGRRCHPDGGRGPDAVVTAGATAPPPLCRPHGDPPATSLRSSTETSARRWADPAQETIIFDFKRWSFIWHISNVFRVCVTFNKNKMLKCEIFCFMMTM